MQVQPHRTSQHPIEVARRLRGLTQAELAERASISRETLNLIVGGRRDPRLTTLTAIAQALGLTVGDLLPG